MNEEDKTYFSAFVRIAKAISSAIELSEVLRLIVKSICETTASKGCTLLLLDGEEQTLEVRSSFGLNHRYVGKGPLLADRSISDTLQGKPIIVEDAGSDPRVQYPEEAKREGITSIVSVPIALRGRVLGALRLYTPVPCRFTKDDIDFLSAVATQSGLALENAKMYEKYHSKTGNGQSAFQCSF